MTPATMTSVLANRPTKATSTRFATGVPHFAGECFRCSRDIPADQREQFCAACFRKRTQRSIK